MRTREEQIKPWGYISPFAKKGLQDRARCDLTITRKPTVSTTMALYTEEQLLEAEHRAEQRGRAEIGRDSERLDFIEGQISINHACEALRTCRCGTASYTIDEWKCVEHKSLRDAIDAAREVG